MDWLNDDISLKILTELVNETEELSAEQKQALIDNYQAIIKEEPGKLAQMLKDFELGYDSKQAEAKYRLIEKIVSSLSQNQGFPKEKISQIVDKLLAVPYDDLINMTN